MPQILFLIIALIIKLAVEGSKDMGRSSSAYSNSKSGRRAHASDMASGNANDSYLHVSDRPTISQAINRQRVGSTSSNTTNKTKTTRDTFSTSMVVNKKKVDEELKDEYKIEEDNFANYDTDDYETFTKDECFEESEHYVEKEVSKYNTYDQRANKIKFMIYVLVYCMYEDDGEFSRKEKRMFKVISKVASINLKAKDTEEIKTFMDVRPNLDGVVSKQELYQLDINDVVETIASLRKQLKKEKQYTPILQRVEKRFHYEL